jgi:two-component system CheB/CheR fusion protein
VAAKARQIVRWIEEGTAKARKVARGLLLDHIEPERLPQELEELSMGASRGQVRCRLIKTGLPVAADGASCAHIFRIAQEAVGNALRHANPRTIEITLTGDENALSLMVEDDGCGLPDRRGGGSGLKIMEHRAKLIGATLSLASVTGKGTRVICRLPMPAPAPSVAA